MLSDQFKSLFGQSYLRPFEDFKSRQMLDKLLLSFAGSVECLTGDAYEAVAHTSRHPRLDLILCFETLAAAIPTVISATPARNALTVRVADDPPGPLRQAADNSLEVSFCNGMRKLRQLDRNVADGSAVTHGKELEIDRLQSNGEDGSIVDQGLTRFIKREREDKWNFASLHQRLK
jgi:hypothetical protein